MMAYFLDFFFMFLIFLHFCFHTMYFYWLSSGRGRGSYSLVLFLWDFPGLSWVDQLHSSRSPCGRILNLCVFPCSLNSHQAVCKKSLLSSRRQCCSSSLQFLPCPHTLVHFSDTCLLCHTWECTQRANSRTQGCVGYHSGHWGCPWA